MPSRHKERIGQILLALTVSLLCLAAVEGVLMRWDIADGPVFEANSHYGYLMRPNQSVSTRGYRFRINRVGLRGDDFALDKPKGEFRIVFLGDSITYGGGRIPEKDLFVHRVAFGLDSKGGRQIEAINVSAPGWGVQNMAAYVATKGVYEADLFIWVISAADFRRPKTSLEDNGFWVRKPPSRVIYATDSALMTARQWLGIGNGPNDAREAPEQTLAQNVQTVQRTLGQIKRSGMPSVVVVVPGVDGYGHLNDVARFESVAGLLSVPFLELEPIFQQHGSRSLFFDGVHLSVRGHTVVADAIVPFVRERILRR